MLNHNKNRINELYDLVTDYGELHNLVIKDVSPFEQMRKEMLDNLANANRPCL